MDGAPRYARYPSLEGRSVLVTGGASGIGASIVGLSKASSTPPGKRGAAAGETTYHSVPYAAEPQSVQRWSATGDLTTQLGVCSGSTSGWRSSASSTSRG